MTAAHSQRVIICFAGVYLPCTPQVSFLIPLQCNGLSDVNTSKFDDQSIFRMALLIMEYSFEILVLEEKKAKSKIHKSGSTGHITFSENAASFLNETKPENLNLKIFCVILTACKVFLLNVLEMFTIIWRRYVSSQAAPLGPAAPSSQHPSFNKVLARLQHFTVCFEYRQQAGTESIKLFEDNTVAQEWLRNTD
jgi:hypothetical protein